MRAFFRLFRIPNLLIVGVLQGLIYFNLIVPLFRKYHISASLPPVEFGLFVLVTILITASGYIINDLIDYRADSINKRDRMVVHEKISVGVASWVYFSTVIAGFFVALFLAFFSRSLQLLWIFPAAVFGLFLYSVVLKRVVLTGNLMVAVFAAGVAAIVGLAARRGLVQLAVIAPAKVHLFSLVLGSYAGFAFLSTLFREMVKDMEDVQGDRLAGYKTLPVVIGMTFSKKLAMLIGSMLLLLTSIGFIVIFSWMKTNFAATWIWMTGIAVITAFSEILALRRLYKANAKQDYRRVSQIIKLIMVLGIIFLAFIRLDY